jgi:hypothetical protein
MLISQPGSDYQIVSISLDAGYIRDLILLLGQAANHGRLRHPGILPWAPSGSFRAGCPR